MEERRYKILIVEDDEHVRKGLTDLFVYHGFDVTTATDGEAGLQLALTRSFDLLIVDVTLPRRDGISLCNIVRESDKETAVIALTALSSDADIVRGFTAGVDDYVTKPFSVQQLLLRVQAVLRRTKRTAPNNEPFELGDWIRIDPSALSGVLRASAEESIQFTKREIDLLLFLGHNAARSVNRSELLTAIWGYRPGSGLETRTVDIHIAKLRKKIEPDPEKPRFLVTIRSEGYQLVGFKGRST